MFAENQIIFLKRSLSEPDDEFEIQFPAAFARKVRYMRKLRGEFLLDNELENAEQKGALDRQSAALLGGK